MNVSILVPAHNEARNIENLLDSLLAQETQHARIIEIVVVASGCTDDTAALARRMGRGRPGMHVIVQERRSGKVAAINEFLLAHDKRAEVIVMTSADVWIAPDVVEKIVVKLKAEPGIGMVGARPVPDNAADTTVGRMVHLLWELHHRVAMMEPKMGELVAFRAELVDRVSELSVVDEASIEDIVRAKGYELGYLPDAVITNHGPEHVKDYFDQRRRIARGHYWLSFAFGYHVATMEKLPILRETIALFRQQDREGKKALGAAVAVEIAARAAGFFDARIVGGRHRVWNPLESTKQLRRDGPPSEREPVGPTDDIPPIPQSSRRGVTR